MNTRAFQEQALAVRSALTDTFTPAVTWLLILVNVLFFAYALYLRVPRTAWTPLSTARITPFSAKPGPLGAPMFCPNVFRGEWWRLLTCCFVHIGALHLVVNMFSLYMVGPVLERIWGHGRFLLLYLMAGLGGSCAMVTFERPDAGAGASGALWGIIASIPVWLIFHRRVLPRRLVISWSTQLVVIFAFNLWITLSIPGISKAGHFGGGLAGLLAAIPLHYLRWGRGWQRWSAAVATLAIPVCCFWMLYEAEAVVNFSKKLCRGHRPPAARTTDPPRADEGKQPALTPFYPTNSFR